VSVSDLHFKKWLLLAGALNDIFDGHIHFDSLRDIVQEDDEGAAEIAEWARQEVATTASFFNTTITTNHKNKKSITYNASFQPWSKKEGRRAGRRDMREERKGRERGRRRANDAAV